MADEISFIHPQGVAGLNIYARLKDANNKFWTSGGFVTFNENNWATYAIPLSSRGVGLYLGNFPSGVAAGLYTLDAYHQIGAGPVKPPTDLYQGASRSPIQWNGTIEIPLSELAKPGDAMVLDFTPIVPLFNPPNSIGDCLNGARTQAFGKWHRLGNILRLYGPDDTTVVHEFALDSPTSPTIRQ
jgi:hypothetical protein